MGLTYEIYSVIYKDMAVIEISMSVDKKILH